MFDRLKKCSDCGANYTEPLLVCPTCFEKVERTDDSRLLRPWIRLKPNPGESLEDFAFRVACEVVKVGDEATGFAKPRFKVGYVGGYAVGRLCTEEEAERSIKPIRLGVSAAICSALRSWSEVRQTSGE